MITRLSSFHWTPPTPTRILSPEAYYHTLKHRLPFQAWWKHNGKEGAHWGWILLPLLGSLWAGWHASFSTRTQFCCGRLRCSAHGWWFARRWRSSDCRRTLRHRSIAPLALQNNLVHPFYRYHMHTATVFPHSQMCRNLGESVNR